MWLERFARAVDLPYEDVAELAGRWRKQEPVSSIEVATVLDPVLRSLLQTQPGISGADIGEIRQNLRDLARQKERHELWEDFEKLLRAGRRLGAGQKFLPAAVLAKLQHGEQLTIAELDHAHHWAAGKAKRFDSEHTLERWRRCLSSRIFPGPHAAIENPQSLLGKMAKRERSDRQRRKNPLQGRAPAETASPAELEADEDVHQKLIEAIDTLLQRLKKNDRTLWRGRNPGRVSLLLEAARDQIDGRPSELGEAVCAQLSAGLNGRRGKHGSLRVIERELSRKHRAVAVSPGTMRRTLKKLRHAVIKETRATHQKIAKAPR